MSKKAQLIFALNQASQSPRLTKDERHVATLIQHSIFSLPENSPLLRKIHVDETPASEMVAVKERTKQHQPTALITDGIHVGHAPNDPKIDVFVPYDAFHRHFTLFGSTGSGRSRTLTSILNSLCDRWIDANDNARQGFTLLEPFIDEQFYTVVAHLQSRLPNESPLWNKIHYVHAKDASAEPTMDIRKWMDEGDIVFILTSGSRSYSYDETLVNHYHVIAQQRPASTSRQHFLIVDEANSIFESNDQTVNSIIREDRKFGLTLGLVGNEIDKLSPALQNNIMENVGVIMSTRQLLRGSLIMQTLMFDKMNKRDLQNLDDNVAFALARCGGKDVSILVESPSPKTEPWASVDWNSPEDNLRLNEKLTELGEFLHSLR